MRALPLAALLCILALAISGCSGGSSQSSSPTKAKSTAASGNPTTGASQPPATTGGAGSSGGTGSGSGSTSGSSPDGSVSLSADVVSGVVPVNVTFVVDSSAADKNATWSIDFGDGSAGKNPIPAFPARVRHTYTKAGDLTATVTAQFKDARVAQAKVVLALKAPKVAGAAGIKDEKFHTTGTITVGTQGADGCATAGQQGVDVVDVAWAINATQDDVKVGVKAFTVNLTWDQGGVDLDLYFLDASGKEIGHSASGNVPAPLPPVPAAGFTGPSESFSKVGSFPAATYTIQVQGCVAANVTFTIDAIAKMKAI